jgi:hypothetical protein
VQPVTPEIQCLSGADGVVHPVHGDDDLTHQHVDELSGTRLMVFCFMALVRGESPIPELHEVRVVDAAQQPAHAAPAAAPEHRGVGYVA